MKTTSSTSILRNSWMILALAVVLSLLLSINWYYFQKVRSSLDEEFDIRLQSLAALVSASIDPVLFETLSPPDIPSPAVDSLLNVLGSIKEDFQLSDILLLREDGVILMSLESSLFRTGEFYPIWNMDYESILSALEGTPASTRLARTQGGSNFKAGYAPFPPASDEARAVVAAEADASFLGSVSDLRKMLSAATAVSILGLLVFVVFVVKATSSLLSARESLLRTETLATMGRMAAGIAHEVRNPLFIIRSSAERLRSSHPESAKMIDEFIIDESDRLDSILTAYLQFARDEGSSFSDADLVMILQRSVRLVNEGGGTGDPQVHFNPPPGLFTVSCDEKRLQQVFMNLLINAVRFTGEDGSVRVRLSTIGSSHYIEIRDTGEGIPPGDIDRIFEPFYTTRNDGSGLGLAVARRITEEHGGRIDVESEEGKGTSVTVRLPVSGILAREKDEQDTDRR